MDAAQFTRSIGCAIYAPMRKVMEEMAILTKSRISPIGFRMQMPSVGNVLTPTNAYPSGIVDPARSINITQGGVLVEAQIKCSFQGNGAGARFFIGAMVNPPDTVNVQQSEGMIASLVYDQTNDNTASALVNYSAYAGPYLDVGTIIRPVFAGSGGGTVIYTINLKIADKQGRVLIQ